MAGEGAVSDSSCDADAVSEAELGTEEPTRAGLACGDLLLRPHTGRDGVLGVARLTGTALGSAAGLWPAGRVDRVGT